MVRDLPEACPGVSVLEREGLKGGEPQLFFCQPVTARVRPGHSLSRPRTGNRWNFAEAQMGVGREEAQVWVSGDTWRNKKVSCLSSQAGEPRGPQLGFRLLWDEEVN